MTSLPPMISASAHAQHTSQDLGSSLTAAGAGLPGTGGSTSALCGTDAASSRLPHPHPVGQHPTTSLAASMAETSSYIQSATHMRLPAAGSVAPQLPPVTTPSSSSLTSTLHSQYMHSQFPSHLSSLGVQSMPMLSPSGAHNYSPPTSSTLGQSALNKPYRPWGAELAY